MNLMQGSFWSAFGVRFGSAGTSGLDEILERENFTLQQILDHEDCIQECKYMNAQLIEYLSQRDVIEQLIKYVITIPPNAKPIDTLSPNAALFNPSATNNSNTATATATTTATDSTTQANDNANNQTNQSSSDDNTNTNDATATDTSSEETSHSESKTDNSFKYPYIASELFACEVVSMLDVIFEEKVVNENGTEVVHYPLLDLLLSFLTSPPPIDPAHASYFRKVVVVLVQRKYEQLVKYFATHTLIDNLVHHIGLYSMMELLIMIGWDDGLGQMNDVEWLYEQQLIPKLVAKLAPAFEHEPDVHMNAARALVDVVVKCPPQQHNVLVAHLQSTPVLTTIFQHMFSGCMSSLTNCLSIIIVLVQRYANRRSELDDKNEPAPTEVEEPFISLLPHLEQIINLLQVSPPQTPAQFGMYVPFGETRMKVVELVLVLLRSRLPEVDDVLIKLNVLGAMVDVFFQYPWNNMLHGLVESIIRTVLDSDSDVLKMSLFHDGHLIEKFIDGYNRNEQVSAAGEGYRLGYMGHLLRTATVLEDVLKKGLGNSIADSGLSRSSLLGDAETMWNDFVQTRLTFENEKARVAAPFVQGDEDLLDGLQFDMNSGVVASKDDDDEDGGMYEDLGTYDYTANENSFHSSEWNDFNGNFAEADSGESPNARTHPHSIESAADFSRGVRAAVRQLMEFNIGKEDDEHDEHEDDLVVTSVHDDDFIDPDGDSSESAFAHDSAFSAATGAGTGTSSSAGSSDSWQANFDFPETETQQATTTSGNDDFDAAFPTIAPASNAVTDLTATSTSTSTSSSTTESASFGDEFDAHFPDPAAPDSSSSN